MQEGWEGGEGWGCVGHLKQLQNIMPLGEKGVEVKGLLESFRNISPRPAKEQCVSS